MEPVRGAGKRPIDGAPYIVKEGYWYCDLCWCYAWGDHMTSAKHLRRLADYTLMSRRTCGRCIPLLGKRLCQHLSKGLHRHRRRALALMLALQVALPHPQQRRLLDQALPQHPAEPWMPAPPPPPRWPSAQFQGSATISAAKPAAGSGSAGSPQIPGPAIGIAVSATGGLEARLTEMEGRLQEHIGSLHAAVQECHSMIATVQMMQTMVQSSGRNLH